ncbi:MAG: hypothetical protein AB1453_12880 [Chloroflexota bacterium]|jgi:hypothetical protein
MIVENDNPVSLRNWRLSPVTLPAREFPQPYRKSEGNLKWRKGFTGRQSGPSRCPEFNPITRMVGTPTKIIIQSLNPNQNVLLFSNRMKKYHTEKTMHGTGFLLTVGGHEYFLLNDNVFRKIEKFEHPVTCAQTQGEVR